MVKFCSLGFHCQSSQILIRNNQKKESYPFDWMFSNQFIINDCIEDDFKKLLNKKYYIDHSSNFYNNNCGHSIYKNNLFPHRDMRLAENYNYLLRCVMRFKNFCRSTEEKIFLMTIIDRNLVENIYNNLNNLKKILNKKTFNFKIVCLVFLYNNKNNEHYTEINDNIHIIYINLKSKSNGLNFKDESDNIYVDKIINNNYINKINNNDIHIYAKGNSNGSYGL